MSAESKQPRRRLQIVPGPDREEELPVTEQPTPTPVEKVVRDILIIGGRRQWPPREVKR